MCRFHLGCSQASHKCSITEVAFLCRRALAKWLWTGIGIQPAKGRRANAGEMCTLAVHVCGSGREGILKHVVREDCAGGSTTMLVRARDLRTDLQTPGAESYGVARRLKK